MSIVVGLTIPAGKVASALTNFVTKVDLSHLPANWWADTTADLGNVRVKSGGSVIPFHVNSYDRAAKTGVLFFKASLTTSDNLFTVETVDSAVALPVTDANGRNAVWLDYLGVWIGSNTNLQGDSTRDLVLIGTAAWGADGLLTCSSTGAARADNLPRNTDHTMGISGTRGDALTNNRSILSYTVEGSSADGDRNTLSLDNGTRPGLWNSTNSWMYAEAAGYWTNGQRHRINATHKSSAAVARAIYRDGNQRNTEAAGATRPASATECSLYVGQDDGSATGSTRWVGTLDHIYLRAGILSADWLAAEYLSWETPASFYTISTTSASLTLSGSATPSTTATADLVLSGSLFNAVPAAGTASLSLSGSAGAAAPAAGQASLQLTASAVSYALYGTDTSNQFSGLSMGGRGLVFVTPGVAEPPFALGPQRFEKAIAFPQPTLVKGRPIFENTVVAKIAPKDQVIMDGRDITWFRADAPGDTPILVPGYELTEPLAYGPSEELRIKRTHFTEVYGEGDLSFLFKGARVQYRRVTAEGQHTIDYRGIVFDVRPTQREWVVHVVGEISGRASQILMQHPLVRKIFDVGAMVKFEVLGLGYRMSPHNGPHTGIRYPAFGGMTLQSYFQRLGALVRTKHTNARAVMPKVWGQTTLEFREIDTETIHFTMWPDGVRIDPSGLVDDLTEQPNTIFGNGVTPEGLRWGNNKYPGYFADPQPYPFNDTSETFGIGTTDEDTDTGTGITTLVFKLAALDYLDDDLDDLTTYTADVADAVNELKEDAGLPQDGVMNLAAWNALFDVEVVGYNPQGARKFPIAQDKKVNAFLYSANGSIIGRNPHWVQGTIRVDREYDYGPSNKSPAIWNARSIIRLASGHQWAGDIVLNDIAVFAGDRHTYEIDSFTDEDLMPARDIRPGMNGKIMYFDGSSTHVHVSGVKVGAADEHGARSVNLTVDTGGRDFFDLAAALERNQETARSPYREWISNNRPNRPVRNMVERDEWFGLSLKTVELKGGQWNEIPVIVGQQGIVNETRLQLTVDTTFAYLVARRELGELWMGHHFGNPWSLDDDGLTVFEQGSNPDLFDDKTILTLQGAGIQRCGFGWRHGYDENGDRIASVEMTGSLVDRQPWEYHTISGRLPIVWLSIYPEDDCSIIRGRWFSALVDDLT